MQGSWTSTVNKSSTLEFTKFSSVSLVRYVSQEFFKGNSVSLSLSSSISLGADFRLEIAFSAGVWLYFVQIGEMLPENATERFARKEIAGSDPDVPREILFVMIFVQIFMAHLNMITMWPIWSCVEIALMTLCHDSMRLLNGTPLQALNFTLLMWFPNYNLSRNDGAL